MTGLPPYLGQSALAKVVTVVCSKNREMLSCCLKFDQFDNLTARSWEKQIICEVTEIKTVLKTSAKLSPIRSLVGELLTNTKGFLEELFSWMTSQYTELAVQKGERSQEDNWKFISHAVTIMFEEIHKALFEGL